MEAYTIGMNKVQAIPDFVIAGAQKCGTTSLYYWLREHPNVFVPSVKEPHYFATFDPIPLLRKGIPVIREPRSYENLYQRASGEQLRGDGSVSYLWDQNAPNRIRQVSPLCKVIVVVRDPVERACSAYRMWKTGGLENRTLDEAIADALSPKTNRSWENDCLYIELGRYGSQIERYLNIFPREQLFITTAQMLSKRPLLCMEQISRFLGCDTEFWKSFDFKHYNLSGGARNKLASGILASGTARSMARKFVPKRYRASVAESILVSKHKKDKPSEAVCKMIWSVCEEEMHKFEGLLGERYTDLWKTYPYNN